MGIDNNWCICACGESIQRADWNTLPKQRIVLGFAVDYVTDYQYFAAVDRLDLALFLRDHKATRIITSLALRMHGDNYNAGDDVEVVDYDTAIGSLDMAVVFAINKGATKITFVGADGLGTAADGYDRRYQLDFDYVDWCKRVMGRCVQLCRDGGCEIEYR